METILQDLKHGLRMLRKNPGFTATAVLTLALGIGANTAVFSVVDAVLLKPLPYAQPERLVAVESMKTRGAPVPEPLSYPNFFDFRAQNHVFEHLVTGHDTNLTLTGVGIPMQLDGEMTTWDLFPALGIQPELGRGFLPPEEAAGTHVVVLSHKLWQTQFGGERSIVGRTIALNRKPYTVVGVAPPGFAFPVNEPNVQLWTTIADDRVAPPGDQAETEQRGARGELQALGRLKPGVGIEQARTDLDVIAQGLAKQYPDTNTNIARASVRPALATLVGESRTPLLILLGAVGLVLLIACANIANLLLARTANREQEMAVRAAIGASRGRVVRQLLTESVLLAILGGAAGTLLAEYALGAVVPLGQGIPRLAQATIDGRVLGFSLLLSFLTSVFFGLAPALHASKIDLTSSLKERSTVSVVKHDRIRGALVIAQVTLGLVLVTGAGLLMASFLHLERSDLGLKPDHLLTYGFSLPESQYNSAQQVAFYDQLLERMRAVPGVQSAAGIWPLPLEGGMVATVTFDIEGRPAVGSKRRLARMAFATPGYFSTAGIPLLKGRFFNEHDDLKAPPVLIVNKAFADKFFPGEDAIGKRITPDAGPGDNKDTSQEIVGIVGSTKLFAMDAEPEPIYYFPYKQLALAFPVVMLRTAVPPRTLESAVRDQMKALDPLVPVFQVRTMDELLATQVAEPRFHTLLLGCFAGIALLLTMVGLYGVMAYSVTRRTREIGVRIALGASRSTVLSMVLNQALVLLGVGLVLGLAASLAADRLLQTMLFGVSALNPVVLALSGLLVGATGLLAAYLPARRAAAMDPMTALRYE